MLKHLVLSIVAFASASLLFPVACEATLKARIYPFTGEIRLLNLDTQPFPFVLYRITSASGSLDGSAGVWQSITDNYDASGNGFIDPLNNWTKVSSLSTDLAEGLFVGATPGSLAPLRSIGLGNIWDPEATPIPDLVVQVVRPDEQTIDVDVQFAIDGDYNSDLVVNNSDYNSWKLFFGSSFMPFSDGNHNGIVDAADYTIWRDNFGKSLLGTAFAAQNAASMQGAGLAAAVAVPEPGSAAIAAVAALVLVAAGRRRAR